MQQSSLADQIDQLLTVHSGTVVAPYDQRFKEEKRLIGAHSSRELLMILSELIASNQLPSVVLIAPKSFSIYDWLILELTKRYDISTVVVSSVPTPLDKHYDENRWRKNSLDALLKNNNSKTLIIAPETEIASIKDRRGVFFAPPKNGRSFAIITSRLTEQIVSFVYDNVLVYRDPERWIQEPSGLFRQSSTPRSVYEYAAFQRLAKNLYYQDAAPPVNRFYIEDAQRDQDDATLILSLHLAREELPSGILERLEGSYKKLERLGLLDHYSLPTSMGKRVSGYGLPSDAGSFLEHWIQRRYPLFPGIVIAAWLKELLHLKTESGKSDGLSTALDYWHRMTKDLKEVVLVANTDQVESLKSWVKENPLYPSSTILSLCHTIKRLVSLLTVSLFGLFHTNGAIERSREILTTIYGLEGETSDHQTVVLAIDSQRKTIELPISTAQLLPLLPLQTTTNNTIVLPTIRTY